MRLLFVGLAFLLTSCAFTTHTSSSGLGYPAGPTLAQFGLGLRCHGEDASCMDRAIDLAAEIAVSLGEPYAGPVDFEGDQSSRFLIDAQQDPPFEWRATDGMGGMTTQISIDLTGVLDATGPAFAVIGGAGDPEAPTYIVPPDHAMELLESLFLAG